MTSKPHRPSIDRRELLVAAAVVPVTTALGLEAASAQAAAPAAVTTQSLAPLMGAPVELGKASNGPIVNKTILDNRPQAWPPRKETVKYRDNIWVMHAPVVNAAFIEGQDGVIVWEAGEGIEDGKHYKEEIRKITKKPIVAVMYSHAHYTLGTSAIIEGEKDVQVIGHPNLNENMRAGGLGSYFPETEPVQWARTFQHLNMLLPENGIDGKFGFIVNVGEKGFVPVNRPVKNGDTLTIAGIKLQFFTEGGSDTNDCMTVWLPDQKVALSNILWPMMPNFYTPRGARFRDPRVWSSAARILRDLGAKTLINQHAIVLQGKDNIESTLNDYLDFANLVLDQTLRGILRGQGPEDLRDFVQLPQRLKESPFLFESYGLLSWYAPYIMNYAPGWWDGDASNLFKLPPKDIAARLVPALGGRDKVLALAKEAQQRKEYSWAMELVGYLWKLDPNDSAVRQLKADLLRTAGQVTTSSIARAFATTQALALEGKVTIPKVVAPTVEQIKALEPGTYVNYHRVRIDPIKAQNTDAMIRFEFTDASNRPVALHVRRGVVEYIEDPDKYPRRPEFTLALTRESWAKLYLSEATVQQLAGKGELKLTGDAAACDRVLDLFDKLDPVKNTLVPRIQPLAMHAP